MRFDSFVFMLIAMGMSRFGKFIDISVYMILLNHLAVQSMVFLRASNLVRANSAQFVGFTMLIATTYLQNSTGGLFLVVQRSTL